MSLSRLFARRIALGLFAAWAVLTTVFVAFTMSRDWVLGSLEGSMRFQGADEGEMEARAEAYLEERGFDRPIWEQYADWMWSMLTMDWGHSFASGRPAFSLVMDATWRTAMYVVPGIALAILVGVLLGLYAALRPNGWLANTGVGTAYLLFALPNFWVGGILLSYAAADTIGHSTLLFDHLLPIGLVASTLLGGYVSFSRAHSLEYASAEFVKLVETKGAGPVRIARHIVRNAAIPFVSMLFSEALALLVLAVFVIETLFEIEGFGLVLFFSVQSRDLPLVLGCTLVIIAVGIVGNILQDFSYTVLDPRVDTDTR